MEYFSDCNDIDEVLAQLAGAASLCWTRTPKGVFDAERALKFVAAARIRIDQLVDHES